MLCGMHETTSESCYVNRWKVVSEDTLLTKPNKAGNTDNELEMMVKAWDPDEWLAAQETQAEESKSL